MEDRDPTLSKFLKIYYNIHINLYFETNLSHKLNIHRIKEFQYHWDLSSTHLLQHKPCKSLESIHSKTNF